MGASSSETPKKHKRPPAVKFEAPSVSDTFTIDTQPSSEDFEVIFSDIRPEDVKEMEAWGVAPPDLLRSLLVAPLASANIVKLDGRPVFAWGLTLVRSGVYALWGFGTPETKKIIRPLTRYCKETWLPFIFGTGKVRRIEVFVPTTSEHSWMWLMWIGCRIETRMKYFGANGEDFFLLSYTTDEFNKAYIGEDTSVC